MSKTNPDLPVQLGCRVALLLISRIGEPEHLEFDLVPDPHADYQSGFLGISTPLAKAILGEKAGVTVPYFTDELLAVEIFSVKESIRKTAGDAVAQRSSALKNARDQIEFTNAVLFAASVDTKWGSYDADGLDFESWKTRQSQDASTKDEEE